MPKPNNFQPSAFKATCSPGTGADGNRTPVTARYITAALTAVGLGTVVAYEWGSSSARALAIGLRIMLAGTAAPAGVLVRNVFGLHRRTRGRRPATASPRTDRINSPIPGAMPMAAARPSAAAGRNPPLS